MHRYILLVAVLILAGCGDPPPADPWRADARQLLARTERLAAAGDLEAATGTLTELEKRGDQSAIDRGRTALARALLTAGRQAESLHLVSQVPWADKAPAVAGELVGLELAIRWRGLFADGHLVSGMIPAAEAHDSDAGQGGGAWLERASSWQALGLLQNGGARMVEREGGTVALPASSGLLALARWAHGATAWPETATALAGDPVAQLAAVHLLLSEHDPVRALQAAESVWKVSASGADEAYTALRLWQLRRRTLAGRLAFWPFPEVEARLDALASRFIAADAAARATLGSENDLGDAGLQNALAREVRTDVVQPVLESDSSVEEEVAPSVSSEAPRSWRLAFSHDGLALRFDQPVVSLGSPAMARLRSDYVGAHHLQLWRITDDDAWSRLNRQPRREDLPERPDVDRELTATESGVALPDLAEGRWVAALSARACPVVVLRSLRVAATALHVQSGVDGILVWTVGRSDGRGVATPLRLAWQLRRDAARAGGQAWTDATPAWRAGFSEGFLGRPDPAWIAAGAAEEQAAGRAAGKAAAAADQPFDLVQCLRTDDEGVLRSDLPAALIGRAYDVVVTVDRDSAHESVEASWGVPAAWAVRAVCWADKPLVRPGERLRFAGLLREHDGEEYRRPEGSCAGRLLVGGELVWEGRLDLDGRGMLSGSALVPPGAATGPVILQVDGVEHRLARCDRLALPKAVVKISCPDGNEQLAGETRRLQIRVEDATGAPLTATPVRIAVYATARDGGKLPVEAPTEVVTDLVGEATVGIPTAEGREASWVAECSVQRDGQPWGEHHAWSTTTFPFTVDASPRYATCTAGGVLRMQLRLPAGAQVRLQATRGEDSLGQVWRVVGGADGTAEALLAFDEQHVGADALLLCADLPGGGEVVRRLPITIGQRPQAGSGAPVACLPASTQVRTGEHLAVTVGTANPGRDVLLVAGTGAIIHHARVRAETATASIACEITPAWSPEVHLQAVAWLPGRGFTTSDTTAIRVLPVDRLLRVVLTPDRAQPRPGETVRVRLSVCDWQGKPVVGAGLTLGAVDQRLYALAEDFTPDLWDFFHDRHRPWRLDAGHAVADGSVDGLLWRSVVWRWQPDDGYGVRSGGGCRRAYGRRGGSRGCVRGLTPSLGTESDPTIFWLAGAVTDAQGMAEAVIELPRTSGTWRLTARAADSSAAVMVGEVRSVLHAGRGVDLELAAPRLARVGDRLVVPVEVANHGAVPVTAGLDCAGSTVAVTVEAGHRRSVPITWTVPEPAGDAMVRRLGGQLGRVVHLSATFAAGQPEAVTSDADVLVVPDGLPDHASLMLVAADDGAVLLPWDIPSGSLVHAELRAWPDVGARRDEELLRWRTREDARGAMAWLAAPPGAQRRAELARRWETLDQSPAAQVVRLVALRLGQGGGGVRELSDDALGDWLRARARLAGLRLTPPTRRSLPTDAPVHRIASIGTALAEGWSDGQRLWRAAREDLLASDNATVLALGLDAARLAADASAQRVLASRLVGVSWDDPFAAVLAAELLPAAASEAPVTVRLAGAEVEARAGAVWSGVIAAPLAITAPPGAVVAVDLRWQAPVPPVAAAVTGLPRLVVRIADGRNFRPLRVGESVQPGQRVAVSLTDAEHWSARLAPACGLRAVDDGDDAQIADPIGWTWTIPDAPADLARTALAGWRWSSAGRDAALAAWEAALQRLVPMRTEAVVQCSLARPEAADDTVVITATQLAVFEAMTEGELRWSPVLLTCGRQDVWVALPSLHVGPDPSGAEETPPDAAPLRRALVAAASGPDELGWLLGRPVLDDRVVAVLAPTGTPALRDLLEHPACGRPGHWTETALRRWLDGEPALEEIDQEQAEEILEHGLTQLVATVMGSRADGIQALTALLAPQAPTTYRPATVRHWFTTLAGRMGTTAPRWEDWLWRQDMDGWMLEQAGYDCTLDGWAAFLREECGLTVRLGDGCFGGEMQPMGGRLGTRDLADRGLVLSRLADGTMLLATVAPRHSVEPARLSIDWDSRPLSQAVQAFNRQLANRGLPTYRLDPALGAGMGISLRLRDATWREALEAILRETSLRLCDRVLVQP